MLRKIFPFLLVVCMGQAALAQPNMMPLVDPQEVAEEDRIENWSGKTVLVFTPHPDDEVFSSGGTLALLAANGNDVQVVVFTNGNKGSRDLEMTRERMAQIRRAEEETAMGHLGIPVENIAWLGYDDGDLDYADPLRLRGEVARLIKLHRPDVMFLPDPGTRWVQWHKTDHRMAATITQDAIIAAEWHLYYPQHLLDEGLEPYRLPLAMYYYSREPNYEVDITEFMDAKVKASAANVSQFPPSVDQYTPDMPEEVFNAIDARFRQRSSDDNGGYAERFRRMVAP